MTRARSLSRLANSTVFTVSDTNRVGIGSTIPDVKLDVGGKAIIDDTTQTTSVSTGALVVSGGVGIGKSLFVGGDMSVAGTLTYEDVTNTETAGITTTGGLVVTGLGATFGSISTHFSNIEFGAAGVGGTITPLGHAEFAGVVTATSFSGDGSGLTGVASTDNINTSTLAQFTGGVGIADSIFHIGDDNTAIRFPAADTFTVETAGSERLRVESGGDVGIGTDNADVILHTLGNDLPYFETTAANKKLVVEEHGSANANAGIIIRKILPTSAVHPAGYWLGDIRFDGWDGDTFRKGGMIECVAEGTPADDSMPANLRISTNAGGTNTTERIRIHADGEVEIKGASMAAGQTPLSVEGNYTSSGNVDIQTWARSGGAVKAAMRYVDADTLLKLGTTTNHGFAFITNANERFRITNGGNTTTTNATAAGSLGVGTDSPGVASGMSRYLTLSAIAADNAVGLELQGNRSGTDQPVGRISFINFSSETARITVDSDSGGANSNMIFATGGTTERLRIASSGQIGLGGANYGTAGQVITSNGSGSAPTWQDASGGISTQAGTASGIITSMFLNDATDHKVTATGICTITTTQSGTEGQSHTIRIVNSGIATVGFSTYFLFPSGAAPVLPTADGAVSLISFTVHDSVGAGCTQLLAGASVNFS